jgi:hypothetical protein
LALQKQVQAAISKEALGALPEGSSQKTLKDLTVRLETELNAYLGRRS